MTLELRRFTAADLENLVALDSDPEVMFYITGGQTTSREEIETEVLPAFIRGGFWVAEVDGQFAGWFHLRPEDALERELGYRLARRYWGQGLATQGSRMLIDMAFEQGAHRVFAHTLVVHTASRRVMEKCGMTVARYFHGDWPYRIPGDELGDVEYEIIRPD